MLTTPNRQDENALYSLLSRDIAINREVVLYLLIFALALFTRFSMLETRVMSHDESLHTRFSYDLYKDGNFSHTPLMHGPVLFHATALSFFLFGDGDFSGRLYTAALGVVMVMFPVLLRRWLGKWGALLASLLLLISPLILYYNRYIRHDAPSILFGLVMVYCILQYLDGEPHQRRRARWLYIFAAAMILNLGSKETAFIYIAIFGSFLTIYFLVRMAQDRYDLGGATLFSSILLGFLLGGVMTLGMYIIVDIVPAEIIPGRGRPFAELTQLDRSSWMSWMLLTVLAGIFIPLSTALYAFRNRMALLPRRELALIFLLALLTAGALLFVEELSHFPAPPETSEPHVPDPSDAEGEIQHIGEPIRWAPVAALWVVAAAGIIFLVRDYRRARQNQSSESFDTARAGFWGYLAQYPEVDILVVTLTLILPWTTALFPRLMGGDALALAALAQALPDWLFTLLSNLPGVGTQESVGKFLLGCYAFAPLFGLMVAIGVTWHWRRWLICAAIFHVIFAFFFTTVFTNIAGLGTGMIYSLGYWLEQQGVRRGSQPQYYYLLIILPIYEFLPVIGSLAAMFACLTRFWKRKRKRLVAAASRAEMQTGEAETDAAAEDAAPAPGPPASEPIASADDKDRLSRLPFLLLLAWWAVLNLVGYSLAGEKMPWLGTHMTTPMILLAAWYVGGIMSRVKMTEFMKRGWMALLVLPALIVCMAQVIGAFLIGDPPFVGLTQAQLSRTYAWLFSLFVTVLLGWILWRVARGYSWQEIRRLAALSTFGLLCLLTARASWMASFVNYDLATEFLVYAHAAPAVKTVLADIDEASMRLTDGNDLVFAYDDEVSWPYSWYFRNYPSAVFVGGNPTVQSLDDTAFVVVGAGHRGDVEPILEDRYARYEHIRMWWPMQEYFGLTPQRITDALDFSPENSSAAEIRRGMWDIWWARDYDRYGDATGRDFSLENWPVSDRMHVYVRKDLAAQMWNLGIGDGEVASDEPQEVNLCIANWQQVAPLLVFPPGDPPLQQPLGIETLPGALLVADESGNRILRFTAGGEFIAAYGEDGIAGFNRPNAVAAMSNGDMLVVDTWNYGIQRLDANGAPLMRWGQAGEYGFDAPPSPDDGFWGPRDVVIDANERAYVADTGNKRVRVYQLEGATARHILDIGSGGSGAGELDEPAGLALSSDGRLFIADTWNRRIAVFDTDGAHLQDFRVRGWYSNALNRPYLALDEARNLLYISDPDGNRILVYDHAGTCIGSFGQAGESSGSGQFRSLSGIAVDDQGNVYAADSSAAAVLKFPPFPVENIAAG